MSGKIDYNELDKAVLQASRPKPAKTSKIGTQDLIAQKQSYPPRTRYMDFIARPRKKVATTNIGPKTIQVNASNQSIATPVQPPRRVARFAPASAGMPNYRIASSHVATKPHSIPTQPAVQPTPMPAVKPVARATKPTPVVKVPAKPVTKPTPVSKAPAQPVIKPVARVASAKPEPKTIKTADNKVQSKNTATVADTTPKESAQAPTSPNANNYSLGVRSPFIRNDAKVEKRPLGASSEYVQDDIVGKNTYEAEDYKAKDKNTRSRKSKKTKVARKKEQKSNGWIWPLIIVLIIAAGGGLGYLAYRVLENAF